MLWFLLIPALYVLILLAVGWFSVFPPRTPVFASPGSLGAPQETVRIEGEIGPLEAWWVPAENPRGAVVFVHGYFMNRAELAGEAMFFWERGYSCLLLDVRGHGHSAKGRCGFGWREKNDVAAAVRWVRERAQGPIGLFGSSMGAAASAFAQGEDPGLADFVILDSAYNRLSGAILGWWRFVGGKPLMWLLAPTAVVAAPVAGLNPFRIRVEDACRKIAVPTLILHGSADNLALPEEARANYAALSGPKAIAFFEGMRHSEARWERPVEYRQNLVGFLTDNHLLPSETS